jgi:hypothetical protein
VSRRIAPVGDSGPCWEFTAKSWSVRFLRYKMLLFREKGSVPLIDNETGEVKRHVFGHPGDIFCECPDFQCRQKSADILDATMGCKHSKSLQDYLDKRRQDTALAA